MSTEPDPEPRDCSSCGGTGVCVFCENVPAIPSSVTPDLRAALEAIIHTLGPEAPEHDDVCEGCQHEIGEALDIARAALASVTPSEPTILDDDPRCAWHDPGIAQRDLHPRDCKHFPVTPSEPTLLLYGLNPTQIKRAIDTADQWHPQWRKELG